jgi:hypothetical protein
VLRPDVAVFAGVLEYIRDVPSLIDWLSSHVRYCVASYALTNRSHYLRQLIADPRGAYWRTYHGYMNSYNEPELLALFGRRRFACLRTDTWNDQRLFLFERRQTETGS